MRKTAALLWLTALGVVALQAMALATRYFQPWLDGDYLLPQRFAADVLGGRYPLSGWTLSSSPYLFPDLTLAIIWHALLGGAPILPYYVLTSYLALALLAGWSLQRTGLTEGRGWIAGALLANALLACQSFTDHARWLWWLGTATFHGGAVLLGLAQFALWAGPPDTAPSRRRAVIATGLLALGLASDTLLLTQFIAPLGLALILTPGRNRWRAPRVRAFGLAVIVAFLLVALFRSCLALADWWNFPKVMRYAPTPSAVTATAGRMLADLSGPVAAAVPGFIVLALVAVIAASWLSKRRHTAEGFTPVQRQAAWFAVFGLASTFLLPVLAVYWQNPQHGRYLLPALILPGWWLLTLLPPTRLRGPWVGGLIATGLLAVAWWQVPRIRFAAWAAPYPDSVAELDRFLAHESRDHGLADFWHAQYLNSVSHVRLRLTQVRPDGRVQFWGNNAFHHFDVSAADGALNPPRYTFILANGLDPIALRATFGEPSRIVTVADYTVWLYNPPLADRLSAHIDTEVRAFLGDRPGTERIDR